MRSKVMTARPAARKGNGSRSPAAGTSQSQQAKKTVAVATKRAEPMVQMVERVRTPSVRPVVEVTKKTGELPIPVATFVF